jgi:toxin ParE1/3/4
VRAIWRDIAAHNEKAADNLLMKLFEKFELVGMHPEMGPARPDIADAARIIIEGNYLAIYEPTAYGIEIVSITHSRRDPATWLD